MNDMPPPTIDTRWHFCGLQVVRMENHLVCIDILPQLGAKVLSFVHKSSGRNLLWHNPRLVPTPAPFGSRFDDHWSGGWDELLPNDVPYAFPNGDLLPDHGEVWSQPAEWHIVSQDEDRVSARFVSRGRVLPTRFVKTLVLERGQSHFHLKYELTNQGPQPIPVLWNIHPALVVSPSSRLDVPANHGFVDPWNTDRFDAGTRFDWPFVPTRDGKTIDLRIVPPVSEAVADFCYLPHIKEGWYAVTDTAAGVGFGLAFPLEVFPHLWLFRPLGGWRGLNTLILEASTGYPNDLQQAITGGEYAVIQPGETLKAEITAVAFAGIGGVSHVDAEGVVTATNEPQLNAVSC